MRIAGMISGSSLDGLDIAVVTFSGLNPEHITWTMEKAGTIDFPASLVQQLKIATSLTPPELLKLEVVFSEFCAEAVAKFVKGLSVEYIASHGHTVFHAPQDGYTLQIGKGSILAEHTGIPSITDFRANDIALGGEGAPVAPIVEEYLLPQHDYYINLGGIANVSAHLTDRILSIDSTPCNQVLNFVMRKLGKEYDDGGQLARTGSVDQSLLDQWKKLDYFALPIPKSMDNSWVSDVFIPVMEKTDLSDQDKLASAIAFMCEQLKRDMMILQPKNQDSSTALTTGGGGFNTFLIEQLDQALSRKNIKLVLPDSDLIDFKEAVLFALMGYLRVNNIPNTIPTVTGAKGSSIGGAIYIPSK